MKLLFHIIIGVLLTSVVYGQSDNLPRHFSVDDQIIKHKAYTLSYNETCEQANWVMYEVTKIELDSNVAKRKNNFKSDKSIPTGSASPKDYKGSGYDRGHLAPAATFVDNQKEMNESFYMSNMSPQHPSFNRGVWKKLEEYERELARENDTVHVITGGILNDSLNTIGSNEVCVPEFFYKIIYTEEWTMCFILKNEKSNEPLSTFKEPLEVVEDKTKINFMLK